MQFTDIIAIIHFCLFCLFLYWWQNTPTQSLSPSMFLLLSLSMLLPFHRESHLLMCFSVAGARCPQWQIRRQWPTVTGSSQTYGREQHSLAGPTAVAQWHPTTPQLSKPITPHAYLHCATAYKDMQTPKRTFNQVQMPHESKIYSRETFYPDSMCTINPKALEAAHIAVVIQKKDFFFVTIP